uniref:Uncharacterized protein n=2 Tax=Tetraselmis sp. GSL018 TaxID=582737 RepID=A0A061R1C2_9CHLO
MSSRKVSFVTQEQEQEQDLWDKVCSVDCTHPRALTLTHHKGNRNPKQLKPADTSTGLVLNAIRFPDGPASEWIEKPYVSTNHFDVDALTSVWTFINRELALQYADVLELVAHLGDFREAELAKLSEGSVVDSALKICCWINTLERSKFSKPWETKDSEEKFDWFLPRLQDVLADPSTGRQHWESEYREVLEGFASLEGRVEAFPDLGLAVARPPRPLHYYCTFSRTVGSDVLLTVYEGGRYELEAKYTQFVDLHSRPVWPRLDFQPLAKAMNRLEQLHGGSGDMEWAADRMVYGGPLMRLDRKGEKLSTVQKYGHPTERPIHRSSIPPEAFVGAVTSFMAFGLRGLSPRRGGWGWDELHEINRRIPWDEWEAEALPEALRQCSAA